jgi:radical SAM protein with 4Fe4S-binding SPASM domain
LEGGRAGPSTCGFGRDELAVAPSGRIYPCDRAVRDDPGGETCLGDLESGLDPARRDALCARKDELDPECLACELRPRCTRWCGCSQLDTTGRLGRVSAVFCWLERTFIAEADRIAALLFSERNEAFLRRFYLPRLAARRAE